jgi:asparagine synthase (glutamine-hydrolysing)
MCGLCGVLDLDAATPADSLESAVAAMAATIEHRGPDDAGAWTDAGVGVALGHRRLAVVDLSPGGHQPMVSASGRWVLAYNGEVYNHARLRADLAGYPFRGSSDTEVLLAAVERWGVLGAVDRVVGMFAVALWDRQERELWLVRDRLGEKPLYWGRAGSTVLFGSELKALRAHPAMVPTIDPDAVALFLRHKYVPTPHTIYRGVEKVRPGHAVVIGPGGAVRHEQYWEVGGSGAGERRAAEDPVSALDELESVLRAAVGGQMVADVPVGAFLSGGVDSTVIVALMQSLADRPIRTFTVGSADPRFDESSSAEAVARHLGTDHTSIRVTGADALAVVPRLAEVYDEPFADSSQIPTFLVSQLAREHVTVSLSGDGGDEVFGGYNRYQWVPAIWRRSEHLPVGLRRVGAAGLASLPPGWVDGAARLIPERRRPRLLGTKVGKVAQVLGLDGPEAMYLRLLSHWDEPERLVPGAHEPPTLASTPGAWPVAPDLATRLMAVDLATYLPDDILAKVDRAAMAVSLETRVPFLDHRVVEYARGLDPALLFRAGEGKWILREIARRHVPAGLVDRPKAGFGVPVGEWLRGPLRAWAGDLLAPERLRRQGLLDETLVTRAWRQHQGGRHDHTYRLWDVVVLQAWLDRWG